MKQVWIVKNFSCVQIKKPKANNTTFSAALLQRSALTFPVMQKEHKALLLLLHKSALL